MMRAQRGVDASCEGLERDVRILIPVPRQKVIVEDVDENAGVAPPRGAYPRTASCHDRMRIGETIDTPMHRDRACHRVRTVLDQRPLYEIPHQAANDGFVRAVGE